MGTFAIASCPLPSSRLRRLHAPQRHLRASSWPSPSPSPSSPSPFPPEKLRFSRQSFESFLLRTQESLCNQLASVDGSGKQFCKDEWMRGNDPSNGSYPQASQSTSSSGSREKTLKQNKKEKNCTHCRCTAYHLARKYCTACLVIGCFTLLFQKISSGFINHIELWIARENNEPRKGEKLYT